MIPFKLYKVSHHDQRALWISADSEDGAREVFASETGLTATAVREIADDLAINIPDEDGARDERTAAQWASTGPGVIGRLL